MKSVLVGNSYSVDINTFLWYTALRKRFGKEASMSANEESLRRKAGRYLSGIAKDLGGIKGPAHPERSKEPVAKEDHAGKSGEVVAKFDAKQFTEEEIVLQAAISILGPKRLALIVQGQQKFLPPEPLDVFHMHMREYVLDLRHHFAAFFHDHTPGQVILTCQKKKIASRFAD